MYDFYGAQDRANFKTRLPLQQSAINSHAFSSGFCSGRAISSTFFVYLMVSCMRERCRLMPKVLYSNILSRRLFQTTIV
jgi:hypothetical protein